MAEDTGAAESQADPTTQPQVGATQQGQEPSAEPTQTLDAASLQRELAEARREAARYRSEAKKYADAKALAERSSLTDQERAQRDRADFERERSEFERERQDFRLREAVTRVAAGLGFIDPEDAFVNLDRSAIEYADDGRPKGLERQLRDILTRKPHLLSPSRTATVTRGVQASGTAAGDWNAALRRAVGVTPD